jgi:hypothetical protein
MVTVYAVDVDVNNVQTFHPKDESLFGTPTLTFDGRPHASRWTPPALVVLDKKLKAADFSTISTGCLITPQRTADLLRPLLEAAGELLPLSFKGAPYHLLNITQIHDCLDHERTRWVKGKTTGKNIRIESYAFRPERLPDSTLFKIPERPLTEMFVHDGPSSRPGFKAEVERLGLQGLEFTPVWSSP